MNLNSFSLVMTCQYAGAGCPIQLNTVQPPLVVEGRPDNPRERACHGSDYCADRGSTDGAYDISQYEPDDCAKDGSKCGAQDGIS